MCGLHNKKIEKIKSKRSWICFSLTKNVYITIIQWLVKDLFKLDDKKTGFEKNAIKVFKSNINVYLHKITYISSPKLIFDWMELHLTCQSLWPLVTTNCGGLRPTREFCQFFGLTQKVKCLSQYWDYLMSMWRPPAMNSLFVTYQTLGSEATTNCCGLRSPQ